MIDLHSHSIFSDGSFTPKELVEAGVKAGLSALALTDHDTVEGIPEFLKAAEDHPIRAVAGVEISADFDPGTMHILGYFVDPYNRMFLDHLEWIRTGRDARNEEVFRKLHRMGFALKWEDVTKHAGKDQIGRPHFAMALIDRGYVKNMKEAFDVYLAKKRPAYAERRRLSPEATIELIRSAGGVAVLAHPYSLEVSKRDMKKVFTWLRDHGLEGVEVFYSGHDNASVRYFGKLAREFHLVATGGSDFHGSLIPEIQLGVGNGKLNVPDEALDELEARRFRKRI